MTSVTQSAIPSSAKLSSSTELSYISILNSIQDTIIHPIKTHELKSKNTKENQTSSQIISQPHLQATMMMNRCFNSTQSVFPRCPNQSALQHSLSGLFIDSIAFDLYHSYDNVSSVASSIRSHHTHSQALISPSGSINTSPPYSFSPSSRHRHLSSEYLEIISWFKALSQSQKIVTSIRAAKIGALGDGNLVSPSIACCEFHFALSKLVLLYIYLTKADTSFLLNSNTKTNSSPRPSPTLPRNLSSSLTDLSSFLERAASDEMVVLSRIYPDEENENTNISRLAQTQQSFTKTGFSFPSPKQQASSLSASQTEPMLFAFDVDDSPQNYRLTELKFSTPVSTIFKSIANKTPTTSQVLSVLSVLPDLSIDALFSCLIHKAVSQTDSISLEEKYSGLVDTSWHGHTKGTFHIFSRLHPSSLELWVSLRELELRAKDVRIRHAKIKGVDEKTLRQQANLLASQWRDQLTQKFLSQQSTMMAKKQHSHVFYPVGTFEIKSLPKEHNRERELQFLRFEEAVDRQMQDKERELYACLVRQSTLESEMRRTKIWREELDSILSDQNILISQSQSTRRISYNKAEDHENW